MEFVADWLNENENRAYPLLEDVVKSTNYSNYLIPDNLLLDVSLRFADGSFDSLVAKLTTIVIRADRSATITFSGTGNVFNVTNVDTETYPKYIRNSNGSLAVFGAGLSTLPTVVSNTTITCNINIEPTTLTEFTGEWLGVSSIDVDYEYETIVDDYKPLLPLVVDDTIPLVGDIEINEGYNFKIDFDNDLLNLEVSSVYGLRMSCDTEFIPTEDKDCDQIVSFINGIPPNDDNVFRFLSGTNINIFNGTSVTTDFYDLVDPSIVANTHTLFIGLTFLETDLCEPINIFPNDN